MVLLTSTLLTLVLGYVLKLTARSTSLTQNLSFALRRLCQVSASPALSNANLMKRSPLPSGRSIESRGSRRMLSEAGSSTEHSESVGSFRGWQENLADVQMLEDIPGFLQKDELDGGVSKLKPMKTSEMITRVLNGREVKFIMDLDIYNDKDLIDALQSYASTIEELRRELNIYGMNANFGSTDALGRIEHRSVEEKASKAVEWLTAIRARYNYLRHSLRRGRN